MPLPRPRVSLLTLMFLMTIVALSFGLYGAHENNRRLTGQSKVIKAENAKIREENGFLTINDPTRIHAIALPEFRPLTWSYRVHLPPGRNYFVACKVNGLPLGGVFPKFGRPPGTSTISSGKGNAVAIGLAPAEYLITLAIFKNEQGDWKCHLNCRSSNFVTDGKRKDATSGIGFSAKDQWPSLQGSFSSGGVSKQMTVVAPDKPIVLLDGRAIRGKGSSNKSTEGVLVWIEPVP